MSSPRSSTIAIIGGGITGLSAAYRLSQNTSHRLVLFEASDVLGGQISTHRDGESWVELGADSFLAREEWAIDLCRALGLEDRLISPAVFGAYIPMRGRLRRMPRATLFGIPLQVGPLYRSRFLSPGGMTRAAAERFNRTPLQGPDVAVARFVTQRFGREVFERLVDPMLAGTRAGDPRRMSLAAAMPEVDALARRYPSLLHAGLDGSPPPFYSLTGGLESLIDALKREMSGVSMQLHAPVTAIEVTGTKEVTLRFPRRDPLRADAAVVALPPPQAARLIASSDANVVSELTPMAYSSARVVTMWFRSADLKGLIPPDGSGFLVPSRATRTLSACTWWSRKWPMSQSSVGYEVLRCFVAGRHENDDDVASEHLLIDRTVADLQAIMRIPSGPVECVTTQWNPALPELEVGHLERVASVAHAMSAYPRIVLAGVPERGSGVTECVRRGISAADRVDGSLSSVAR